MPLRDFLSVGILILLLTRTAHAQRSEDRFVFWHISDTYASATEDRGAIAHIPREALSASSRPAFLVHTGNISFSGRQEEYMRFKEAFQHLDEARIRFYAIPGRREMRYAPEGKTGFQNAFGKLYQSFDYGGTHFVLLDTTVALQPYGHIDRAQLKWLAKDLERVRPETPILLFLHHEFGQEPPGVRPIANEFELWPLLRGKNVIAIFTAEGRREALFRKNGATIITARQLGRGTFHRVTVTPLLVTVERVQRNGEVTPVVTIPVSPRARPSVLRAGFDDGNTPYLVRRHPIALLNPRAVNDTPEQETAEIRINDGAFSPMVRDARDIWRAPFRTEQIPVGVHSATIRLTTSNQAVHEAEIIFEVERDAREPTRRWAADLDGPIQSDPLLVGDTLYVSCLDHRVYALNTINGRKRWTFTARGPFLASPVLGGNTLYIGSTDGTLYALDASNGRVRWRYDTGKPIYATAAVARGVVCLGGNQRIHGIDATTGRQRWVQPAGRFFQSRAATDGTTFYVGGWDGTLYALEAESGALRWARMLGQTQEEESVVVGAPAVASPTVAAGRVFISTTDGRLIALRAEDGQTLWTARAPKGSDTFGTSSGMVIGPTLFVAGTGDADGHGDVYALDTASGKILWQVRTGQNIVGSSPRLAPDGRSFAIMGMRGKVSVLDTLSGARLWGYELGPGNIFSTPEYDGRAVYTVTMANDVQVIDGPGHGFTPGNRDTGTP